MKKLSELTQDESIDLRDLSLKINGSAAFFVIFVLINVFFESEHGITVWLNLVPSYLMISLFAFFFLKIWNFCDPFVTKLCTRWSCRYFKCSLFGLILHFTLISFEYFSWNLSFSVQSNRFGSFVTMLIWGKNSVFCVSVDIYKKLALQICLPLVHFLSFVSKLSFTLLDKSEILTVHFWDFHKTPV